MIEQLCNTEASAVRIHYAKAQTFTKSTGAPVPNNTNISLGAILGGRGDELIDLAGANLLG